MKNLLTITSMIAILSSCTYSEEQENKEMDNKNISSCSTNSATKIIKDNIFDNFRKESLHYVGFDPIDKTVVDNAKEIVVIKLLQPIEIQTSGNTVLCSAQLEITLPENIIEKANITRNALKEAGLKEVIPFNKAYPNKNSVTYPLEYNLSTINGHLVGEFKSGYPITHFLSSEIILAEYNGNVSSAIKSTQELKEQIRILTNKPI